MSKFVNITLDVVIADGVLAEYLWKANIGPAKRGGAFVSSHDVAPDEFRRYGIVLPKGGMIIPHLEARDLKGIILAAEDRIKAEDSERRRVLRAAYLEGVEGLLEKASLLGLVVREEATTDLTGPYHRLDLCRDGEKCLLLWFERGTFGSLGGPRRLPTPWLVWSTDEDVVARFLDREEELIVARRMFEERFAPKGKFSFEKFSCGAYSHGECALQDAHEVLFHGRQFPLTEEGFTALEEELEAPFEEVRIGFNDACGDGRPGGNFRQHDWRKNPFWKGR